MESHGVEAGILKEFILPSSTADPEDIDATVRSWEVFKVLEIDLGLHLSEDDKKFVSTRFGDGEDGGRVDVRALLVALGLGQTINSSTDPALASVRDRGEGNRWPAGRPTSASRQSGRGRGRVRKREWPSTTVAAGSAQPARRSSGSEVQGRGVESRSPIGADATAGLDLDIDASRGDPATDTPPPAYEDVLMHSDGAEAEERASADGEKTHQSPTEGNELDGAEPAERSVVDGGQPARGSAAAAAAEEENARLRAELAVFDVGFFEEVEDLKYSYAILKREAEKLAKKQGVDLAVSLGLPEDGEEPWDRAVDMAHRSVDWAETARRRPPGSPSSPPRGVHATRLARRWNKLSSGLDGEGEGVPDGAQGSPLGPPAPRSLQHTRGPRRVYNASARWSGERRGGGKESAAAPQWNGLIAAHERKLAWELSTGGMGSLACLREHVGRIGRSGDGFGSDEEVFSALSQSGYALEQEDVAILRTGLGNSADGKVDLEEFMTVCEDVASGEGWYVPAAPAAGEAAPEVVPSAMATMMMSPENWDGAASMKDVVLPPEPFFHKGRGPGRGGGTARFFGSPAHQLHDAADDRVGASAGDFPPFSASLSACAPGPDPLYLGGTAYGDRSFLKPSKNTEEVLVELEDQLKLLDIDRFFRSSTASKIGTSGGRAAGLGDAAGTGGATLGQAVGVKFSRRDPSQCGLLSARELGLALEDVGVSLHPDEAVTLAKKFKPPGQRRQQLGVAGSGSRLAGVSQTAVVAGDGDGLDDVVAEYAPLVRLVVDCLAEASGIDPAVGGRAKLGQRGLKWNERMPAPAKRLKVALAAGAEGGGWLERLRQRFRDFDIDGNGCLGRREFMRALNLALACETGENSDPSPDFTVGGLLSEQEATELMGRLDRDRDGRVCWEAFVEYFADAEGTTGSCVGGGPPETWFQREGEIAEKLLQHMEVQGGLTARRAWVNSLRRRFQTADPHRIGALEREEFARCLRSMRVSLSVREGERLFSALLPTNTDAGGARYPELVDFLRSRNAKWYDVERGIADKIRAAMGADSTSRRAWLNRMRRNFMSLDAFRVGVLGASDLLQALRDGGCYLGLEEEARLLDALETEESARFDTEGGVSYRELLLFCARHAGKWNDSHPELAEKLREALRSQAKTVADIRRLFRRLDDDGDGLIGRKDFKIALHRLGLGFLTREEEEGLMDALDGEGSGSVRYADFSSFFMDADPWFKSDADLAERLCQGLESFGGDGSGPGTVLATLRERFVAADSRKSGFLNATQFRVVLADLPGTEGLTEDEVERLITLLDEEGDGRVSYRSLLGMLVRHLGDWVKRLPEVASELSLALQNTQYGLKACVENLSRRLDIADHSGTGRLSPPTLGRCLRSVGLILAPHRLNEMVAVMDAYGDGLIPTAPVLEFLRKEAGLASGPDDPAVGNAEQAGGKLGAAFRNAVRSLAKAEQEYARLDDSEEDGDGPVAFDSSVGDAAQKVTGIQYAGKRGRRRGPKSRMDIIDGSTAWATLPWRTCLRRVFDRRLDLDGDGFLTEGDLTACLPEIGVDVDSRGSSRALLCAMDSRRRGLGQATFRDFLEFMGGESTGAAHTQTGGERGVSPELGDLVGKVSLEPSRRGLLRQVRLALGLPATATIQTTDDSDGPIITRTDLRHALARLDPRGSGRLPLGKIKAALQGLGLEVGRVPRASWLDLTGSLDQDAYGDMFYADFVDLFMAPSPSSFSPKAPSNRKRVRRGSRAEVTTSAGSEARGGRTRQNAGAHYGAYSDDEDDAGNGVSDDSIDVWRGRTSPPVSSSSPTQPSSALDSLAERILDGVFDQHGGGAEGGRAIRSALRRQDLTRRHRESKVTIGGIEFKRLLRSAGLDLKTKEISYLRQKCGDASGQVNALALLAYLGPPERFEMEGGNDAGDDSGHLLPSTVLRGRAQERNERPKSNSSAGLRVGRGCDGELTNKKAEIRARIVADFRR
eukprot:g16705.t1